MGMPCDRGGHYCYASQEILMDTSYFKMGPIEGAVRALVFKMRNSHIHSDLREEKLFHATNEHNVNVECQTVNIKKI